MTTREIIKQRLELEFDEATVFEDPDRISGYHCKVVHNGNEYAWATALFVPDEFDSNKRDYIGEIVELFKAAVFDYETQNPPHVRRELW